MVTIRSGVVPSLMLIRAPLCQTDEEEEEIVDDERRVSSTIEFTSSRMAFMLSPRFPMMLPTS